jgi:hypothetical protein
MARYEKRGFIKEYNEDGMLLSKVQKSLVEEVLEEDLFGDE